MPAVPPKMPEGIATDFASEGPLSVAPILAKVKDPDAAPDLTVLPFVGGVAARGGVSACAADIRNDRSEALYAMVRLARMFLLVVQEAMGFVASEKGEVLVISNPDDFVLAELVGAGLGL